MARNKQIAKLKAVYKSGYSSPVPADAAYAELEAIRGRHGGVVRAADVVDESRPEDAPLHPAFEWNDHVAAENWREDQARRLVRSVCLVPVEVSAEPPRPVYVHVPTTGGRDEPGYTTVAAAMAEPESRNAVLRDALAQLRAWRNRFGWLSELAGLTRAIDDVSGRLDPDPPARSA